MACATSLVKYLLFLFNFLFVIGGGALIIVGALTYTGNDNYVELVDLGGKIQGPPIAMMIFGSIMFVIAFMGCCGALRESNCMMMTYSVFLFVLLVVEIAVAVALIYYKDDFEKILHDGFSKSIQLYNQKDVDITEAWDNMQQRLKCCGITDYNDWSKISWAPTISVPESCCRKMETNCGNYAFVDPGKIYTQGCLTKALEDIKSEAVIYAGFIVAGVELLGIIFACCLGARFRNKVYRNPYQ